MDLFTSVLNSTIVSKILHYLNIAVPVCLGIYIFLNPFPHVTALQEISFYGAVFITLILISSRYYTFSFKNPLSFLFLIYVGWSILSIFWSIDKNNSLHDVRAHLVEYVILYFLLVNFFCSWKKMTILIWIAVTSTTIFSMGGMLYFYVFLGKPLSERLLALPNSPGTPLNTIAIISLFAALISFFFVLKERHMCTRALMLLCCIGTVLATLLTYSRGSLVGLIVAAVVMLFSLYSEKKRKLVALIVVSFILVGSFAMGLPTLRARLNPSALLRNARLDIWHVSVEMIKDRPLYGFGFGMEAFKKTLWNNYKTKVPVNWNRNEPYEHPHNFILYVMVRLGIIGLLTVALILFCSFKMSIDALRSKKQFIRNYGALLTSALAGVLIAGLFSRISYGQSAVIFYTILAMITILWRLSGQEKNQYQSLVKA